MKKSDENALNFDLSEFLSHLNEAQREAVISCGQPQLVLSGAGSGKTRVLTYKIIYLLKIQNINPENILALTFTNKAANEMKERITNLIGEKYTKKLVMGTFHSVFCKILRHNIYYLEGKKYKPDFKIIVEHEVKDIIKTILEDDFNNQVEDYIHKTNNNDKIKRENMFKSLVKKFMEKIKLLKNRGITWYRYNDLDDDIHTDELNDIAFFKNVYRKYVEYCQEKNLMDFEDLILNTFLLFSDVNNINVLDRYQKSFKYILVDEYQDTNSVQYEIVKALSWQHKNLFVVGDDYQNIYSFRGASRLNIDRFQNDFNNYKMTKLCQNYRSNKIIVNTANKLINNNKHQILKELFSKIDETEGKIKLFSGFNEDDEANKVGYIIQKLISENKCNYNDIAILYRINSQHIPFKQAFFKMNIPHKISNANTIFDSKYIKIIYYYLRFIDDQTLDFCVPKIINFPKRNIGKKTVDKLISLAKTNGINCWEIINNCENKETIKKYHITKAMSSKFAPFRDLINHLISFSKTNGLKSTIDELLKLININEYIKDDSDKEKIDLLLEKINEMEEEHFKNSENEFTLSEFLEDFSLLITSDENDESESKNNQVKLMTIHKAKGLEFKYVFIVGFEEGYFPFGLNIGKEEDFEEERRILYVGITRAKINCYLSFALERTNLGANSKRIQSSFLAEINDFNFIQNYFIEDEKNYELYKNKYINISKRAKESQINKSKKEEKCRKYINLNYIKEEENENEINQVKNNFYQNCNNIPTYANPFLNYNNNNYYLENPIQVNKFDINSINNENYSYRARKENNPNEILNNEKNETTNEITKDKRKGIRKEKKADINKNKNKNKSKYKTIESCFNIKSGFN